LIAGVGTYTLEIMEALPDVDFLIVPVGTGSGVSSAALVAKTVNPNTKVIAVQAERAPALFRSWKSGNIETAPMETTAEGVATRVAFENTLTMMRDPQTGIDDFLLVSDESMEEGVRLLLEHTRNVAELGGAAPLAAALQMRDQLQGAKVVLVLSGGNISMEKFRRIVCSS
jgi:threonine dehydratase